MPRRKKFEERKAEEYLISIGHDFPVFEPTVNSPPDFLIGNSIAVEVRRLNQQVISNSNLEPIEKLEFKIEPKIKNILNSIKDAQFTNSANIILEYSRPLKINNTLQNKIKEVLINHLASIDEKARYNINDNLSLDISPLSYRKEKPYVLLYIDEDTGGMILNNLVIALNYVIDEKSTKIKPHYAKYKTWWLLLVDYISPFIDPITYNQVRAMDIDKKLFDKIIIISPEQPTVAEILQ